MANFWKFFAYGLLVIIGGGLSAQNPLPFFSDFESGTEGWTMENGTAANQWVRGNNADGNDGYCLYISSDGGATNDYVNTASVAHAYVHVTIPADGAVLKFRYRVVGDMYEGDPEEDEEDEYYDYLGVTILNAAPTANQNVITRWDYADQRTWKEVSLALSGSNAGDKYIVFTWFNDGSSNYNPAAAIDDVRVMPLVKTPGNLTFTNRTASSLTVSWTASATAGVKYRVQEAKGENGANAPWTTVAEDLAVTTLDRTGLDENTNYYYRIQAYIDESTYSDYTGNYTGTKTLYACPAPTELDYALSSGNYVFTWTSEATAFQFEWKEATAADWTKVENLTAATYTLNAANLSEATTYTVRVKAICNPGDAEVYTSELGFATPCPAVSVPYAEDFNVWTDNRLACWTIVDANNDGKTWQASYSTDGVGSTYCAKYSYSGGNAADDYLVSPGINLSRAASLSFKLKTSYMDEKYSVLLSTTGTAPADFTEVLVPETPVKSSDWLTVTADLDKAEWIGNVIYIAVKACSDKNKAGLYVDDFSIVSCAAPSVAFSNLTTTTAQIDITSPADKFTVEYKNAGATDWTVLTDQLATVPLSGLTDGTAYKVRVKAHCSADDESLYSEEQEFYTPFAPQPFPLYEDFITVEEGKIPFGWDMRDSKNGVWKVTTEYSTGVKYLAFREPNQRTSNISTPIIDLSTADRSRLELVFTYKVGNYSGTYFKVSYSLDNGLTWTELKNTTGGNFTSTTKETVSLPMTEKVGDAATLVVRFEGIGSSNIYSDHALYEVKIRHTPVCFPPTELAVDETALTARSARLTWTAPENGTPLNYTLNWQSADETEPQTKTTSDASAEAVIDGLTQHTVYYVKVSSNCATESSEPVTVELTTPYSCPAVTGLALVRPTHQTAEFAFKAEGTGDVFEIEYRELPVADTEAEEPAEWRSFSRDYAETAFKLENLKASASYQVRVRVVCNADDQSSWDSLTFNTLCEPALWPLAEGFESDFVDNAPACWSYKKISGVNDDAQWERVTDKFKTGGAAMRYKSYSLRKGSVAVVASPLLNFNPDVLYTLSFWMYRDGSKDNAEGLKVFVNDRPDTVGGKLVAYIKNNKNAEDGSTSDGNGWNFYTYDITETAGYGHIVLCGISEWENYFYIDDLRVDPVYEFNVAVQAVKPIPSRANLSEESVSVILVNTGVSDLEGELKLSLQTDDADPITETVTIGGDDILLAEKASTFTYTFNAKADLSQAGVHTVKVSVALEGDPDEADNIATIRTTHYEALDVPYRTRFVETESPYFHIVDANKDNTTWTLAADETALAQLPASAEAASDDYLYTPGIRMQPGVYEIGLTYAALASDAEEKLALAVCADYESEGLPVMDVTVTSAEPDTRTAYVEIVEPDAYMMRLHGYSEAGKSGLKVGELTVDMRYYFKKITAMLCKDGSYVLGDRILTEAGLYTDTVRVTGAADTIVYLTLGVASAYAFSLDTTVCEGETVTFGGKTYDKAGTYTETYLTVNGCDSIYTLTLAMKESYAFSLDTAICAGETVMFGGKTYDKTGTYTETYATVDGCDSTYTLQLTVTPLAVAPVINRKDEDGQVVLEAQTDEKQVQWYNATGLIEGETALRYIVMVDGIYHATTANRCGESEPSNRIEVKLTDNEMVEAAVAPLLYPNPARTTVTLRTQDGSRLQSVRILSGDGRTVWAQHGLNASETVISVSAYEAGLYMVRVETESGAHAYKLYVIR